MTDFMELPTLWWADKPLTRLIQQTLYKSNKPFVTSQGNVTNGFVYIWANFLSFFVASPVFLKLSLPLLCHFAVKVQR